MKEGIKTKPKESRLVFLTIPCTPQQKPCETVLSSELQIINACVEQTCVFFQLQHVWLLLCTINFFPLTLFIHFTCSFLTRRHSQERWKKCHPHAFSHIWCWCKLHCTNQRMLSGCFFFLSPSFRLLYSGHHSNFPILVFVAVFVVSAVVFFVDCIFCSFWIQYFLSASICIEQPRVMYATSNTATEMIKKTHCWSDAHVHFLCRKII